MEDGFKAGVLLDLLRLLQGAFLWWCSKVHFSGGGGDGGDVNWVKLTIEGRSRENCQYVVSRPMR